MYDKMMTDLETFYKQHKTKKGPLHTSRATIVNFSKSSGLDITKLHLFRSHFPKSAYATELERYPLLKDEE